MELGVTIFPTDQSAGPVEVAVEAEARGFSSVFFPEHTHIPVSRRTPAPMAPDGALPDMYARTLDAMVSLGAVVASTSTIRVGTGISLVAQHDPIILAKQVATLDHLSHGRMVFGIGFGWNREELEDHGVAFAERRDVVRERMLLMNALWSQDVAGFEGDHVKVEPSWCWPKPVQQPRVRTLIGGAAGPKLFAHIAEYGDGWFPIGGRGVGAAIPELRDAVEKAGRDPSTVTVVPFGTVPDAGKLDYYAGLGITEVVLQLPSAGRDEVLSTLDRYAAEFLPD